MNVGDCVVVLTAHDAGWIQAVQPGGLRFDVYLKHARAVRAFDTAEIATIPIRGLDREYLQGPFLVRYRAKRQNGVPILRVDACKVDQNGLRISEWTRVV